MSLAAVTSLRDRRKFAAAPAGLIALGVLLALVVVAFALGIYVALPLILGILVFPALTGATGWAVFGLTAASFAAVWLVMALITRLTSSKR